MMKKIYKNNFPSNELIKVKHRGKIFTPDFLVNIIMDQGNYVSENINKKHVIDNSCGDGQFMVQIVKRYCDDFLKNSNDLKMLKYELETYIHAIEIEHEELEICKKRCSQVTKMYGIKNVKWNFINDDTLKTKYFDGKMDFVLGNPPYVRVHNLNNNLVSVKDFAFGNEGMTDLYIVFYEASLMMLNETGIISYITPSSFFTSMAGRFMRNYFINNNLLESICDLKHFQPFNATTYTTIVCLNKAKKNNVLKYYEFDTENYKPYLVSKLEPNDYNVNNNFYFSTLDNLNTLKKILKNNTQANIFVKNGYATLADKIFIGDFDFNSDFIIPIIKASRAKWSKIIYPYTKNNKLIKEEVLMKDPVLFNYLSMQKNKLAKRSIENNNDDNWFAFGRSQAIVDTYKKKLSINTLIRTSSDLKLIDIPSGCGVYSGLYIISDTISFSKIKEVLHEPAFSAYISLLGKYKSGGYYTFSSKDLKCFLDYKFGKGGTSNA